MWFDDFEFKYQVFLSKFKQRFEEESGKSF